MKRLLQTIVLVLLANCMNAQSSITGQVFDSETMESLPYVNIGIQDSKLGTVSDVDGYFMMKSLSSEDILVVSYIGYETQKLATTGMEDTVQILLKPIPYMIDEVKIISSSFGDELLLGVRNENGRGNSIGFGNAQLGTELGALIHIEKETFVKSANFVLNHAKGDSLLLRINMYDYTDGTIGEKILRQNIFVKDKQRKGTYTINLEKYEILLYNDILLSVEWLRDFDEEGNKSMTFDTKKSKKYGGTFIRISKTLPFRQLPIKKKYKPCIYLIGKQSTK